MDLSATHVGVALLAWLSGVLGAVIAVRAELRGIRRDVDRHEQEIAELRRKGARVKA